MKYDEEFLDETFWEETDLDVWFKTHYKQLGFEEILPSNVGYADYVGTKNGKRFVIELESALHCIASHTQQVLDKIDIIICYGGNYNGEKDINKKEIIRLVDYPKFFFEAISPRIKYIRKLQKYKREVLQKWQDDLR